MKISRNLMNDSAGINSEPIVKLEVRTEPIGTNNEGTDKSEVDEGKVTEDTITWSEFDLTSDPYA